MFFNGWEGVVRVLVIGPLAYIALVVLLRVSGKRTLSKMNAFDFVVTVAFGSTLASVVLSKTVSLLEGVVAFAVLILCQYVITYLSVRSERFQQFIKASPTLLYHQGRFLSDVMRRQRVTEEEVRSGVRESGHLSLDAVAAVVLETDGSFSVIATSDGNNTSAMANISNPTQG
ncbi:DUF421 domain-containing protein [soil metagenome]